MNNVNNSIKDSNKIKKYKILYLMTTCEVGGSTEYLYSFLKEMKKTRNYELSLIVNPDGLYYDRFLEVFDHIFEIKELKTKFDLLSDLTALMKIYRIIKKNKFDLVHIQTSKASFLGAIAVKFAKNKNIVFSAHGYNSAHATMNFLSDKFYLYLRRIIVNNSSFIAVASQTVKNFIINNTKVDHKKVEVIYTGVNFEKFSYERRNSKKNNNNQFIIGSCGRLIKIKGHEFLIRAAKLVIEQRDDVNFVIYGEGPLKNYLNGLIVELKIEKNFIIKNFIENISEKMIDFDVYVQPSMMDSFPLAPCEAMAMGIPVITTKVGGFPEMVNHGINGYLVDFNDYNDFKDKMLDLINDSDKRRKFGINAYEHAVKNFNWSHVANKYDEVYKNIFVNSN